MRFKWKSIICLFAGHDYYGPLPADRVSSQSEGRRRRVVYFVCNRCGRVRKKYKKRRKKRKKVES